MENSYEQGFAFILEAATELAFYDILLNFLAERHPECKLEKRTSDEIYEYMSHFMLCKVHLERGLLE